MVRWDIEGYIGIQLNFRKNDRGVLPDKNRSVLKTSPTFPFSTTRLQAPPHYFRSANSISQSKYCVKACNFRII